MSSDSTELTFVRCPSCRSLVPAMSTRCRMCGVSLETTGDDKEEDASGGRVRQRTMSTKGNAQLNSAVDQIRSDYGDEPAANGAAEHEVSEPVEAEEADASFAQDDVQEMESPEPSPFETSAPLQAVEESEGAPEEDSGLDAVDPLGAFIEEVEVDEASAAGASEFEDDLDASGDAEEEFISVPAEEATIPPQTGLESADAEAPSKVVVETGVPKRGSRLSFGDEPTETPRGSRESQKDSSPRDEAPVEERRSKRSGGRSSKRQEAEAPADDAPRKGRSSRKSRSRREQGEQREQAEDTRGGKQGSRRSEPRAERQAREHEGVPKAAPSERQAERAAPAPKRSAAPAKRPSQALDGRLSGWLVSYANANGDAIELREGKFFVTSSSLKEGDLVLDDESVSTPHSLVTMDSSKGLVVQDLMSDRGVFVRRRDVANYERVGEQTVLEHGDWVRFGDVEFLVTLIAHVGEM